MAGNYIDFQQQGSDWTKREVRKKQLEIIDLYKDSLRDTRSKLQSLYAKELQGIKPEEFYNHTLKFNRLEKLEQSILDDIKSLQKSVNKVTADSSALALSNNYYRQQYATNWLSPYTFTNVSKDLIEYAVFSNPQRLRDLKKSYQLFAKNNSGTTLRSILDSNNAKAIQKINQTINSGLIQGQSYRQMAGNLKGTFDSSLSASLRVVRTESHRTLNIGELGQWDDAKSKGVDGTRMIISTLDTRTRPQSAQVDGRRENEFGLFDYPNGRTGENGVASPGNSGNPAWDINDREAVVNLIDDQPPTLRRGRNPTTGKNEVFTYKDFNQWASDNGLKYNKSGRLVQK